MKVKDIMTRREDLQTARPSTNLQQAAHQMAEFDIGELPVCDADQLLGVITDRDITIRGTAEGRDPKGTTVGDIMTTNVICCYEDQSIDEAAKLMEDNQIRRLLVLNRKQELVGVLSLGDLALRRDTENVAEQVLHRVSEPS